MINGAIAYRIIDEYTLRKQEIILQQLSKHKKIAAISTIVILIVAVEWASWYRYVNKYATLNQASTPADILRINDAHYQSENLTFEFYYSPKCKDCQELISHGLAQQLHQAARHYYVTAINTDRFKLSNHEMASQWFVGNRITNTPTLIVKRNSRPLYSYAGKDMRQFKTLLAGKNPKNCKSWNAKENKTAWQYSVNDFTHCDDKVPSIHTTTSSLTGHFG